MQTTALELITDAYKTAGLLGEGEPLTAERGQFAFRNLNDMLDSWAIDSLYVKQISEIVATIAAGSTFTVGPSSDVNTPIAPSRIETGSFFRINNMDYTFGNLTRAQCMSAPMKDDAAEWPDYVFYNPGVVEGTAYMFPALSSPASVHLLVQVPLASFADLTTPVDIPTGYKDAIILTMSERACLGRKPIPPDLARSAMRARRRIRDANINVPVLGLPLPVVPWMSRGQTTIFTG